MSDLPEFDAYELNRLQGLAMRSDYYRKCHKFVMDFVDGKLTEHATLTEKQKRWLWGIKADLKEEKE
ncbi:MAG: hypothetical protein EPN94_10945 [Nitrospirae bacterium]|nr:MAG: hypothetical protein EPN94_10945 [Nitrospirota bacterium]